MKKKAPLEIADETILVSTLPSLLDAREGKGVLQNEDREGYWSKFGYPADGVIQPEHDYQLDICKTVWIEEDGNIEQADK
jgi:hypothetical protein